VVAVEAQVSVIRELTALEIFTVLQTRQNMGYGHGVEPLIEPNRPHRWCDVVALVAADVNGDQQYSTASTIYAVNIGLPVTDAEVLRDKAQHEELGMVFEDPRKEQA
jgi:hypothetical protein